MKAPTTAMTEVSHRLSFETQFLTMHLAIRQAAAWYNSHIGLNLPPVRGQNQRIPTTALVTDDAANRTLAGTEHVQAVSGKRPKPS